MKKRNILYFFTSTLWVRCCFQCCILWPSIVVSICRMWSNKTEHKIELICFFVTARFWLHDSHLFAVWMCFYFFHSFLWSWWQLRCSSTYSLLHSVLRVSLVTPYRSSLDGVLTREVLASPPFSIGSLLKQLCLDLTQPVFPRPQRTHKNTLAKSETTLQYTHVCVCVCVCVSIQAPFQTWDTLDSTWLCCGYAWTHKKRKYISMHIMHTHIRYNGHMHSHVLLFQCLRRPDLKFKLSLFFPR